MQVNMVNISQISMKSIMYDRLTIIIYGHGVFYVRIGQGDK